MFVVICDSSTVSSVRITPPFVLPCPLYGRTSILHPVGLGNLSKSFLSIGQFITPLIFLLFNANLWAKFNDL